MPDCIPNSFVQDGLLAAIPSTTNGLKVHLIVGDITVTPDLTLTDVAAQEATGSWYTSKSATRTAVYGLEGGKLAVTMNSNFWSYGESSSTPEDVTGWYVTDSTSSSLYSVGALEVPVTMQSSLDAVIAEPVIALGNFYQS